MSAATTSAVRKKAAAATTTAPAKPRAVRPKIFQIFYREEQRSSLDPAFIAYDNSGIKSPLLEFDVFRRILTRGLAGKAPLWGVVSWKFGLKTELSGAQLIAHLRANPGCDAYYCNPYPEFEAVYHNLWQQGETAHPGFLELARRVFQAAGLPLATLDALYPAQLYSAANYIVATPAFWRAYIGFIEDVLARLERHAAPELLAQLLSATADAKGRHAGATYLPFIVERLFSVFLISDAAAGFRTHKYPVPAKENRLNVHLGVLRQQKELVCQHRNPQLTAWWLSHRALYLVAEHGRDWVRRYLPRISPSEICYLPEKLHAR